MEKSAVWLGLGLVALVVVACSSAVERDSFAAHEDDAGDPAVKDDADAASPSDGSDEPGYEPGDASDAEVDASADDASDAAPSVCTGDPPPAATSDDCRAIRHCAECGDDSLVYRCEDGKNPKRPEGADCSVVPISNATCCAAGCVRRSSFDDSCPEFAPVYWECASVEHDRFPQTIYKCTHLSEKGDTLSMCCQVKVVPELL